MTSGQTRVLTRGLVQRVHMLLPGVYAWVITVATFASQRGAGTAARGTALAALVALVAGPLVALDRPRVGRVLGVHVFVALCIATWALLGPALAIARLDPVRAFLGAVGWGLFAFGWGSLRNLGSIPEEDPHAILGPPLPRRGRVAPIAAAVVTLSVVSAVVVLLLAFRVARPTHALLGHSAALLAAVALLFSGSRIAVTLSEPRSATPPRQRLEAGGRSLAGAALLLSLGVLWLILR